jgi:hypothetical protein
MPCNHVRMHRMPPTVVALALLLAVALATPVAAEPLDGASADALDRTLGTLRQGARTKPLDGRLGAIEGSPEMQQEFNDLAAAVFSDLAARYDGDPDAMAAALARGKSDPAAFADALSPATRARLEKLSRQLDDGH